MAFCFFGSGEVEEAEEEEEEDLSKERFGGILIFHPGKARFFLCCAGLVLRYAAGVCVWGAAGRGGAGQGLVWCWAPFRQGTVAFVSWGRFLTGG